MGIRIVFFGIGGPLSIAPLEGLLAAGYELGAIVMGGAPGRGNGEQDAAPYRLTPPTMGQAQIGGERGVRTLVPTWKGLAQVAQERGVALLEARRLRDPRTLAALASFAPDVICVACFARRLPPELLALPRLGCVNLHPSLLPANRGPDPNFWTFRLGAHETGVSVHLMDAAFDSGPILLQERIAVEDGLTEQALERRQAERGAALLVEAVAQLVAGRADPRPQDEAAATAYGAPRAEDYVITAGWAARHADAFARGVMGRPEPITIVAGGGVYRLVAPVEALDDGAWLGARDEGDEREAWLDGDLLTLRCSPGIWRARVQAVGAVG